MTDLQALLDQIDRLDQEATQTPWELIEGISGDYLFHGDTAVAEAWGLSNAMFIELARTALPQLANALQAVMNVHKRKVLHKSNSGKTVTAICEYCSDMNFNDCYPQDDTIYWPCPTVQAITDALGVVE